MDGAELEVDLGLSMWTLHYMETFNFLLKVEFETNIYILSQVTSEKADTLYPC